VSHVLSQVQGKDLPRSHAVTAGVDEKNKLAVRLAIGQRTKEQIGIVWIEETHVFARVGLAVEPDRTGSFRDWP
jgi:hypothetical protein